jgi:hypothetical protein
MRKVPGSNPGGPTNHFRSVYQMIIIKKIVIIDNTLVLYTNLPPSDGVSTQQLTLSLNAGKPLDYALLNFPTVAIYDGNGNRLDV